MSETNERSVASTGSVEVTLHVDDSACGLPESRPLRRPGLHLTDAEREAVKVARDAYASDDGNEECEEIAAVLSRLLERTK